METTYTPGARIFRSAYSPPVRVSISFPGQGRTKQSFKDECDINLILRRYLETGVMDHVRQDVPQFIDCTEFDYQTAMDIVADAKTAFYALPASLRDRFNNSPQELLEFVHDPRHEAECVELGLLDKDRLAALRAARAVPAAETPPPNAKPNPTPPAEGGPKGGSAPQTGAA